MRDKTRTLHSFFISPPFGRWIRCQWATPILGSYSWKKRPGLIKQTIKTLRPIPGGWVNKIGIRNPGLQNVTEFDNSSIYSVIGFTAKEWSDILKKLPSGALVELNLGCPNVEHEPFPTNILHEFLSKFSWVSIKFPPSDLIFHKLPEYVCCGLKVVHLCNTIPTERGGESGNRLKELSLQYIRWARSLFPDLYIIGGGGIYNIEDIYAYRKEGANGFSLSTIWFTPWRVRKIKKFWCNEQKIQTCKEKISTV